MRWPLVMRSRLDRETQELSRQIDVLARLLSAADKRSEGAAKALQSIQGRYAALNRDYTKKTQELAEIKRERPLFDSILNPSHR